jgi:hypothetical protein
MTTAEQAAAFPVARTFETLDLAAPCVPQADFDYVASLKLVPLQHVTTIIGPPGTGKSVSARVTAVHELLLTAMHTNAGSYATTVAADAIAIN